MNIPLVSWTSRDKAIIFRGLSVLLNSGVHVLSGLESLAKQAETPDVGDSLRRMAGLLATGQPLHRTMQAEARVFSPLEVGLVKVGETSGSLHSVLARLADVSEKSDGLRRKLKAALVYPAFVLVLCTALLVFAPVFVFADLLKLLTELKTELPLATKMYIAFSSFLTSPVAYALIIVAMAGVAYGTRSITQDPRRQRVAEEFLFGLPGLGGVLTSAVAAEVSGALSTCYGSGIPLLRSVSLAREVTWSELMRVRLEAAQQTLQNGGTLVEALEQTRFFSPMSLTILMGGEQVGLIAEALQSVETASVKDTELALEAMQKLVEPVLLLFVGVIVGFIAIAMLAPTLKVVEGL